MGDRGDDTEVDGLTRAPAVNAHQEVIRAIEPDVGRQLELLPAVDRAWQPSDYLPVLEGEDWVDRLATLRQEAAGLPDDVLVVLVGDMVTEEALPSYSMALNQLVQDTSGTSPTPWARWLRGWTAEENRHGDLLNAYLRLSGRVDMRAVEQTVHTLLRSGFDSSSGDDPYNLLVYTAFQERATRIAHGNVARLAEQAGANSLSRICRVIAGDEARHETFYTRMLRAVLDLDPEGGLSAIAAMLERQIVMPGRGMGAEREPDLFDRFAAVAQRIGVYTAHDYADIVEHLVTTWRLADLKVVGNAASAQEWLCTAAPRYRRLAERVARFTRAHPPQRFSWIDHREV